MKPADPPAPPPPPQPSPDDALADLSDDELEALCCQNFCKYCVKVRAGQARARRVAGAAPAPD